MENKYKFQEAFIFSLIFLVSLFLLFIFLYINSKILLIGLTGTLLTVLFFSTVIIYSFIHCVASLFVTEKKDLDILEVKSVSIVSVVVFLLVGITFILMPFFVTMISGYFISDGSVTGFYALISTIFIIPGILLTVQGCRKLHIYMKEKK